MKNILIISLAAMLTACSLSPAPQSESQPATRSAEQAEWQKTIASGTDQVRSLFFTKLQQKTVADAFFIKDKNIDPSDPASVTLKGIPVYRLDSTQYVQLTPNTSLEEALQLDTNHADFLVIRQGTVILLLRAIYDDGWQGLNEISNGPMPVLAESLMLAFSAGEDVMMVEAYPRRTIQYTKHALVFRGGRWVDAATGRDAVESLMAFRDRKPDITR